MESGWLKLARAIRGQFGDLTVMITDISSSEVTLEHREAVHPDQQSALQFEWQNETIRTTCRITSADEGFFDGDFKTWVFESRGDLTPTPELQRFLAGYRDQVEKAEKANLEGNIDSNVIDGVATLADLGAARKRKAKFIQCRMQGGRWDCRELDEAAQPPDGFTVSAQEDADQVRLLRLSYEESDDEGRAMIREFAALSLGESH